MSLAIVMPWRTDDGIRARLHDWTVHRWAEICPDVPLVESDSDGPWSRAQAINGGVGSINADVYAVVDADVWMTADMFRTACRVAHATGLLTTVDRTVYLDPTGTTAVVGNFAPGWETRVERVDYGHAGGATFISAGLWESTGGFDSDFVGWGWQDVAFRLAATTLAGPHVRLAGESLYHMWHPRSAADMVEWEANRARLAPYIAADGDIEAMRALVAER